MAEARAGRLHLPGHVHTHGYGDKLCKPEGVGSEFADIFIRLLDDAWLFGQMDLEAAESDRRPVRRQ